MKPRIFNISFDSSSLNILSSIFSSRDHAIVLGTVKITFNIGIESTDKTRSIIKSVGRALVKKKMLMLLDQPKLI